MQLLACRVEPGGWAGRFGGWIQISRPRSVVRVRENLNCVEPGLQSKVHVWVVVANLIKQIEILWQNVQLGAGFCLLSSEKLLPFQVQFSSVSRPIPSLKSEITCVLVGRCVACKHLRCFLFERFPFIIYNYCPLHSPSNSVKRLSLSICSVLSNQPTCPWMSSSETKVHINPISL